VPQKIKQVTANGVELLAGNGCAEMLLEFLDVQTCVDQNGAVLFLQQPLFFQVVLILNVPDDLSIRSRW
jgi:hypothetical protein